MSFDVFLIASDASPMGAALRAATDRALAACGARRGRAGEFDIVLASGYGQEVFGGDDDEAGGMFALRDFGPELVQLIFAIADSTQCFIIFPGDAPVFLRTPGNTGAPPADEDAPITLVANAAELGRRLRAPFEGWADYADAVLPAGLLPEDDDDDDLPEPDPTLLDRFFKRPK